MTKVTRPLLVSLVAFSLLCHASCVDPGPVGTSRLPIINGQIDDTHKSVVALTFMGTMFCSGTVIAPRAILTAGHCVEESGIPPSQMQVFFGTTVGDGSAKLRVSSATVHPGYYVRQDGAPVNDVAVLTLSQDAPVPPMVWQRTPLQDISGSTVTLVGYGVTNASRQSGDGTRRTVDLTVQQMDDDFIYYGGGNAGTCQGDSGGPMFLDVNGTLTLVGVTSWGDQSCVRLGGNQRVDTHADFIMPLARLAVDLLINSPAEGETVGGVFTVDVSASSLAGVAEVDVFVDDQLVGAAVEPPFTFEVGGIPDGEHVVKVIGTGKDQGVTQKTVGFFVSAVAAGAACGTNADCASGVCADSASGNGFCSQACQTSADCPNHAACNDVSGGRLCGPPDSAASGCQAGGRPLGAGFGLFLLAAAFVLAARRRR